MVPEALLCIADTGLVVHDVWPVRCHCKHHLPCSLIEEPALQGDLIREALCKLFQSLYCPVGVAVDPGVAAIEPDIAVATVSPAGVVEEGLVQFECKR